MTDKNVNQGFTIIVNSPGNIIAPGSKNITMNNSFFGTDASGIRRWERAEVVNPIDIADEQPSTAVQPVEDKPVEDKPCRRQAADPSLLSPYVDDDALRSRYARRLSLCCTARELGAVVCDMISDEGVFLHREEAVRGRFIEDTLMMYAVRLTSGTTSSNIRKYINRAVERRELEEKRKLNLHVR